MRRMLVCLLILLIPRPTAGCLWDFDTLLAERKKFPTVLELATGKFIRHSPEFYQWRIRDRQAKLKADPTNRAYYDDLAVAYDKVGQQDKAIEVILAKDQVEPGLYETEANLGTFLIHAGKYEEGLQHINQAIEINPDAHFGREKYQVLLVEYLAPRLKDGKPSLPLASVMLPEKEHPDRESGLSFADFLRRRDGDYEMSDRELGEAVKGITGIMRFSKHDSPVLLEALGSLLTEDSHEDAKQLAARAYLQASYQTDDTDVRDAYREMANDALQMQVGISLSRVETQFKRELADAEAWYSELREKELSWIDEGVDVDAHFAALYDQEPEVPRISALTPLEWLLVFAIVALSVTALVAIARRMAKSRHVRHGERISLSSNYSEP